MPIPIAVPIVGGVLAVGAIALRLRAVAQAKNSTAKAVANVPPAPPAPPPVGPVVSPAPPAIAAQLPALITNPDGSDHTQGTPFIFDTNADAAAAVAEANRRKISVQQLLLEKSGQLGQSSGDNVAALGQQAVVTTNDPAPSGDLIIRSGPSMSSPQIGGAEKNGTVTVLNSSDPVFAQIRWGGGSRLPAATGFAKKQFLKLV